MTTTANPTSPNHRTRRTLGTVAAATAVVLSVGLAACGTDDAVRRTTVDADTTTSVVAEDLSASTPSSAVPSDAVDPANPGNGGSNSSGPGADSDASTDNAGNAQAEPVIDRFTTPDSVDCHNGNVQQFTVSWETSNTTKVTISIDGPGIYDTFTSDSEASLPFTCVVGETQTVLLTAYGHNGQTATRSVTIGGRNIQGEEPDEDDESAMGVSAKTTGGSTGNGSATQDDCDRLASLQDDLQDKAAELVSSGQFDAAIYVADISAGIQDAGETAGCFFVFGPE